VLASADQRRPQPLASARHEPAEQLPREPLAPNRARHEPGLTLAAGALAGRRATGEQVRAVEGLAAHLESVATNRVFRESLTGKAEFASSLPMSDYEPLPPGYQWTCAPTQGAPIVRTPFGATIACYGDSVDTTLAGRASAAARSFQWFQKHGAVASCPPSVPLVPWWAFVSRADASIYPHLLSHVEDASEWLLFEHAGLTRGALAVYTDLARRGLLLTIGALSDKHADAWSAAAFARPPDPCSDCGRDPHHGTCALWQHRHEVE
jgi:hypothetical protein